MKSQDVTLTWEEYRTAARIGFDRHYRATSRGYKGNIPHAWTSDIEGACAEAAVNKFLFGKPKPAKDQSWSGPDLPGNVEVKSFWRASHGYLKMKLNVNDPERSYVFVERLSLTPRAMPTYRVLGYLSGENVDSLQDTPHGVMEAIENGRLGDPEQLRDAVNTFIPEELKGLSDREMQAYIIELGDADAYQQSYEEQFSEWLAERDEST